MKTATLIVRLSRALVLILLANAAMRTASAQPAFLSNALDFGGTNQYVSVPAAAGVELNGPFTVESWVYIRSYALWSRLLDFGNGPANNNVVCALTEEVTGRPLTDTYNGATRIGRVQSSVALPLNAWAHLAFTCDGTSGYIYINGSLAAGTLAGTFTGPRTNNYIGRSNWIDDYANAIMGEFRIWNVARSQAQIQGATNAVLAGNETGLRLYYRFDGTGNTVTNRATVTGSAYNGTLVNGPTRVTYAPPPPVVLPPALKSLRIGDKLVLHWPGTTPRMFLEFKSDLSTPGWISALSLPDFDAGFPFFDGVEYWSTNLISHDSQFYRLNYIDSTGAPICKPFNDPPTLGPIPGIPLVTTRFLTNDDVAILTPDDPEANYLDGVTMHVLDASGFRNPAYCQPGQLLYHWTISTDDFPAYSCAGIYGYHDSKLYIMHDSIPPGIVHIHLDVTSNVIPEGANTPRSAAYDLYVTVGQNNMTPEIYTACRFENHSCPDCPCRLAEALPPFDPP